MEEQKDSARAAGSHGPALWHDHEVEAAIVGALPEYLIVPLDGRGAVTEWNDGAERITGYRSTDVAGQRYDRVVVDGEPDPPLEELLKQARSDGRRTVERWWRRREGGRFMAHETLVALPDDRYALIARDTTDRRAAEQSQASRAAVEDSLRAELQQAERRAAFVAEASSILVASSLSFDAAVRALARLAVSRLADWCVIYAFDPHGRLRHAEVSHRDPRQETLLRPLRSTLVTGGTPDSLEQSIREGRAVRLDALPNELAESISRLPNADRIERREKLSIVAAPLLGRGRALGAMMLVQSGRNEYTGDDVALAEELARRAAIAIDNARLYHEAQEANRAKADFLAIMSHELRTPLNAIMGYTDLLDAGIGGPLEPQQQRQLARIRASARQLLQLIEEVLGFARLEAGSEEVSLQRVPLAQLARDAAEAIEPFAQEKNLDLRVDVGDVVAKIESDPIKLRQILVNLLSNAVKFTESGGVTLRVSHDDRTASFEVEDSGIGIAEEEVGRIFDPFWQVDSPNTRRSGGTGLGLSVSLRYARLLGGDIVVTSEPGRGSRFTVQVPLRYDESAAEGVQTEQAIVQEAHDTLAGSQAIRSGDGSGV